MNNLPKKNSPAPATKAITGDTPLWSQRTALARTDKNLDTIDAERFVSGTIFRLEFAKRSLWKIVASTDNTRTKLRALDRLHKLYPELSSVYELYHSILQQLETPEEFIDRNRRLIAYVMEEMDKDKGNKESQNTSKS